MKLELYHFSSKLSTVFLSAVEVSARKSMRQSNLRAEM